MRNRPCTQPVQAAKISRTNKRTNEPKNWCWRLTLSLRLTSWPFQPLHVSSGYCPDQCLTPTVNKTCQGGEFDSENEALRRCTLCHSISFNSPLLCFQSSFLLLCTLEQQVVSQLPPLWETQSECQFPSSGLAESWLLYLGNEPVDGCSVSLVYLSISLSLSSSLSLSFPPFPFSQIIIIKSFTNLKIKLSQQLICQYLPI